MSRVVLQRFALITTAGLMLACAGAGAPSPADGSAASAPQPRHDRSTISAEELKDSQASNLFDVVQRLHPEWLTGRNGTMVSGKNSALANSVQVYIDTQRNGTTDVLRQISLSAASSIRYYTATEAQARFGNGNLNCAIQVVTVGKP
jgi:hypothetical protein